MVGSDRPVSNARVTAVDSGGRVLAESTSDSTGRFTIALRATGPVRIEARKIGVDPSYSEYFRVTPADTLEMDVGVPADVPSLPTVEVPGTPVRTRNELAYDDAVRRGWKVYPPEKVAAQRERYHEFMDLLRGMQVTGIRIGRPGECIQSTHFNGRCLAYVIDGVPAGPFLTVLPSDVYFFAVVSATDAAVLWGNRAPWGAVVIYTRMNGDRNKP